MNPAADHILKLWDETEARFLKEGENSKIHHVADHFILLGIIAIYDIQNSVEFIIIKVEGSKYNWT